MNLYVKRSLSLCLLVFSATTLLASGLYVDNLQGAFYLALLTALQTFILLSAALIVAQLTRISTSRTIVLTYHSVAIGSLILLMANYKLHSMYNYFIDGFVINLITTPGGIDALGLSRSFYISMSIFTLFAIVLYAGLVRYTPFEKIYAKVIAKRPTYALLLIVAVGETAIYSYASYISNPQILAIASRVAWHMPVSARGFYEKLGLKQGERALADSMTTYSGDLAYPPKETTHAIIERPYNIIWLTAESLRADMLTAEIMPNTWAFGQSNSNFKQHYSGGNGTRLGMFSQFYGLYGSYWFEVLEKRKSPLLMDILAENNYDITAFTSARFTYPEFDKTIFSKVAGSNLNEYYAGKGWERDRKNTVDLVKHISQVAKNSKPFFAFMFFESSHANYYFPDGNVIRENYQGDFDYLTTDIGKNIELIKNRYINATHYLDTRLGLIFDALRANDLEDNTIVIVTGDHGEEFMEKGRWGHNSTFVQEQIRVPLVIHIPGRSAQVTDAMTSHLDMPATVLAALGYRRNPTLYSFGEDLFSPNYNRTFTVASDWHGDVLITPSTKILLTLKGAGNSSSLTTLHDKEIDANDVSITDKELLGEFIQDLPRFRFDSPAYKAARRMPEYRSTEIPKKVVITKNTEENSAS